jgi:hypothetical protein
LLSAKNAATRKARISLAEIISSLHTATDFLEEGIMKNRVILSAAACAVAALFQLSNARADITYINGVPHEFFNLPGKCSVPNQKTLNPNPECYTIPSVQISLEDGNKLPYLTNTKKLSKMLQPAPTVPNKPEPSQPAPQQPAPQQPVPPSLPMPGPEPSIGDLVNAFKWFWKFVEDNRAVVNVDLPPFAAALPKNIEASDLENWGDARALAFRVQAKNGFGMEAVRVTYLLQYTPLGSLHGRGKFLNNVTVVPREVHAAWGYRVDLTAKVLGLVNFGTSADPIAGVQLEVMHIIQTTMKKTYDARSYVVRGDGRSYEVLPTTFVSKR